MIKVVIDTNVFVSSFFGGIPKRVIELWRDGKVALCLSQEMVEEYVEVLLRLGIDKEEVDKLLKLFADGYNSLFLAFPPQLNIVKSDPDDNKFIECAVGLGCKYVVSGDKHLLEIRKYIDIEILSLRVFVEKI